MSGSQHPSFVTGAKRCSNGAGLTLATCRQAKHVTLKTCQGWKSPDLRGIARDFYARFYHIDLNETQLDELLRPATTGPS
jgi:hypothetical protein